MNEPSGNAAYKRLVGDLSAISASKACSLSSRVNGSCNGRSSKSFEGNGEHTVNGRFRPADRMASLPGSVLAPLWTQPRAGARCSAGRERRIDDVIESLVAVCDEESLSVWEIEGSRQTAITTGLLLYHNHHAGSIFCSVLAPAHCFFEPFRSLG